MTKKKIIKMNVFLLTGQLTPSRGGHDGSFNSIPKVGMHRFFLSGLIMQRPKTGRSVPSRFATSL